MHTLYRIHKLAADNRAGSRFTVKNIPYGTIKTLPLDFSWGNPMVCAVAEVAGVRPEDVRYMGEDGKFSFYLV